MLFDDAKQILSAPLITDGSEEPSHPGTRVRQRTQQEQGADHLATPKQTVEQQALAATEQAKTTLEQAISDYLHEHEVDNHSDKTLEWHRTALGLMKAYLEQERGMTLVGEVDAPAITAWFTHLRQTPGTRGTIRSQRTIQTYARSARAFFHWLVRQEILQAHPFDRVILPSVGEPWLETVTNGEFEQLLLVCAPAHEEGRFAERMAARNRAILWVFYDTGIRLSELTNLRVEDLDRERGVMTIKGKGSKGRRIALGQNCLSSVLSYMDRLRPDEQELAEWGNLGANHLYLSETGQPLSNNGVTLLFARLKKRAGITGKRISPHILRHTFAIRYLELSHDPFSLQKLLGYEEMTMVKQYIQMSEETLREQQHRDHLEDHLPSALPEPRGTRRRGFRGKEHQGENG